MGMTPHRRFPADKHDWMFVACVLLTLPLAWRPLRDLLNSAINQEHNSHVLLVLPIVVAMLMMFAGRSTPTTRRWSLAAGIPVLLTASVLGIFSIRYATAWGPSNALSMSIFSLVTFWLGLTALFYGVDTVSQLKFPLLFLFLLVPLPDRLLNAVTYWLQYGSTLATQALFIATGIPVARDGFVLSLPHIDIEVAAECSGIRSTMILVLTTMVLGHLFLRSVGRQIILFVSVVIVAVLKNALRIYTLSVLAMYVDPSWIEGDFHHRYGGSVFFVLALVMILGVLRVLRRSEQAYPAGLPQLKRDLM